ncbi:MAG: TrbC/VirB2 family protein [Candidatus Aenigmarchaeota archaeon]|nr:TrbC/VirB2 family protein [Candidatus Aenigmarchaeota archaeon]
MFTKTKKIYLLIVLFGLFFLLVGPALAVETDLGEVAPIKISTISGLNQKVGAIIKIILGVVGALALVMVIYGGFMWMTSGGKADQVKKGKDTLVWAVAGLALIFFSYVLVNFVITAMTTGGNSSSPNNPNSSSNSLICGGDCTIPCDCESLGVGYTCLVPGTFYADDYDCQTRHCGCGPEVCCKKG